LGETGSTQQGFIAWRRFRETWTQGYLFGIFEFFSRTARSTRNANIFHRKGDSLGTRISKKPLTDWTVHVILQEFAVAVKYWFYF